jgi:DNA-binding PadR family transcriptional regulator
MSVKNAVLGLLIERPGYGYELMQRLNERVDGLQLSESAVYPALDSLEKGGHIRRRGREGAAHRMRLWFEATPEGIERFDTWMDRPSRPLRGDLRWKIAVATFDRLPKLIEQTREEEQACLDRMELLTRAPAPELAGSAADWAPTGRLLLRRTDVKLLQVQIEALQEARAEMKQALRRRARRSARASE